MNRRNSRTIDALNKSESYQYDGNSNLTKYTDRNGQFVNYTYDGINRRTVANFQGSTDIINYTWDAATASPRQRIRWPAPSRGLQICWTASCRKSHPKATSAMPTTTLTGGRP